VTTRLQFKHLRAQAAIRPPALVAKQAGSLAALFDNRLKPRCRHQPVAGGLRDHGRAVCQARQADGRVHRRHPRPHLRRLLPSTTASSMTSPSQDDARADQADSDPDRRPRRRRPQARRPQRRLDARRRRPHRTRPTTRQAEEYREEEERIGLADEFQIHVISIDGFTLDGVKRLEDKASPTSSSASGSPTSWGRTPSRSTTRSATWSGSRRTSSRRLDSRGPPRAGSVVAVRSRRRARERSLVWLTIGRVSRRVRRPQGSARGSHLLSPEYPLDPRLTRYVQSRSFRRHNA